MQPVKTEYVLSLSYGKDSLACLGAIEHLGWPLDRIVTADVWATDDIPAEYPPVVAFKKYVDNYIKEHYGITVEHYCCPHCESRIRAGEPLKNIQASPKGRPPRTKGAKP